MGKHDEGSKYLFITRLTFSILYILKLVFQFFASPVTFWLESKAYFAHLSGCVAMNFNFHIEAVLWL